VCGADRAGGSNDSLRCRRALTRVTIVDEAEARQSHGSQNSLGSGWLWQAVSDNPLMLENDTV
jgi:hypothetical protein